MSTLLAAIPGRWDVVDAETVWWLAARGARSELLELREHATMLASATYRTRDEHVAAVAPQLGLTATRAARLFDALVERGLIVPATVAATPGAVAPLAIVDASDLGASDIAGLVDAAALASETDRAAARALIDPTTPGGSFNIRLLAAVGPYLRCNEQQAGGWLEPADRDARLSFVREHAAAAGLRPAPATTESVLAALGCTWAQLANARGIDGATLAGQPGDALAHWRDAVIVRAVVGGATASTGIVAPRRASMATAVAAPLLAIDARELVPFAIFDGDADSAWQVTALDAMHGLGSVLAVPQFRATPGSGEPALDTRALFSVLAQASARFASADPFARFAALTAIAGDLADSDDRELGHVLRRAALALLASTLDAAPDSARAAIRGRIASLDDPVPDLDASRSLVRRIARGGALWPALWQAAIDLRARHS